MYPYFSRSSSSWAPWATRWCWRCCCATNLFILNLGVADLCFILCCVPFQATIYTLDDWVFGSLLCKAVHFLIFLTMHASSFTLAAVSLDR